MSKIEEIRKNILLVGLFILLVVVLMACSGISESDGDPSNENNDEPENRNENHNIVHIEDTEEATEDNPLEIDIVYPWGEEQFDDRFRPIEDKMGNVEINYHWYDGTSDGLQELFAADVVPDIIISPADNIEALVDLDAIYPLEDLVEQEGFDLSRINPGLLSLVKGFDRENCLIGLPDGTGLFALYYNKEVFDIFGEDYPSHDEPMTWQEVLDLARKMTGEHGGQDYIGFEFGGYGLAADPALVPLRQFAAAMTDAETGEVLITEDPVFVRYLELMQDYIDIPGILSEEALENDKFAQKTAAMTLHWHNYLDYGWGDLEYQEDMDFTYVPVWEDMPNTGPYLGTAVMAVATYGENKVTAFRVLAEYLSAENQKSIVSTMASGPAVIDQEVLDHFGVELDQYKDRDTSIFFEQDPAEFENYSHYDRFVPFSAGEFATEYTDIHTFLREVKEKAEANIEEAKAQEM